MTAEKKIELMNLFNQRAPIARFFGMRLCFESDGRAVVELPYNPNLDHALGGIHGGIYATMLDNAGWFASAVSHEKSCWVATSEMSFHLFAAAKQTSLRAVGRIIKSGKRQDVCEMFLYDESGQLVAHATGTFIVLPSIPLRRGNS
ncbi:MAG: PaaI family thioesterase [Syntrophaceae bacterium]|nr:PaaI family thioesterase [Syntrophaceae bacterium]